MENKTIRREKMDYKKIAQVIIDACGGKENVASYTHCLTRLRVVLTDQSKYNDDVIKNVEEIKGHILNNGENQFILGSKIVTAVYDEFKELAGEDAQPLTSKENIAKTKAAYRKTNVVTKVVQTISEIFVPIIPAVISGGLLMCICAFLTTPGFFDPSLSLVQLYPQIEGLVSFLNMLSGIPFTYLPVLVGFTAAKKFGGTPIIGATLGLIMVNSALLNPASLVGVDIPVWDIFGIQVQQIGYHSTVIPIIAAAWIYSKIEIFGKKHAGSILNIYIPFFSLLITSFIVFLLIGPVLREAGYLLTDGLVWIYQTTGVLGGMILGVLYAPMVITGLHHSFIPIETQLVADIASTGGTFILPIAAMSNVAIGASALAVGFLNRKSKKISGEAFSSGITSIIGVSEPALFGINLKYRFAFVAALTGSSIGSGFFALIQMKAISMGAGGLLGLLCYRPEDLPMYILGMIISMAVAFSLTIIFSKFQNKISFFN